MRAFLAFVLAARAALACSCVGPNPVCSAYWNTPVVFLGHVVRIETIRDAGENLVHFEATRLYRGIPSKELVVHTSTQGSACGYGFAEGHDYLVYGYIAEGKLSTGLCTRTHEVTDRDADADLQWIEGLSKAPPGASVFGHIVKLSSNQEGGYDRSAIAGVKVSIAGPQLKTVSSEDDGNFRADGLAPGKYVVSAAAPRQYAPFGAVNVTVKDRACTEIYWGTKLDGHIRGRAYFSDGTPAGGLYLTAKLAGSNPHEPWTWQAGHTSTASDGTFDFPELAPGSYIFAVNMDFTGLREGDYYRRAFYPGTVHASEAAAVTVGPGQIVDDLRFDLPPDAAKPTAGVHVTVLDFDGKPVPRAQVLAYDDIWENSVTPINIRADETGKATFTLRPGLHYDIEAYVSYPDGTQACAEPVGVDVQADQAPIVLALSHHFGNCRPFRKSRGESR